MQFLLGVHSHARRIVGRGLCRENLQELPAGALHDCVRDILTGEGIIRQKCKRGGCPARAMAWPMAPGLHKALCIKRVGGQVDMSTLATPRRQEAAPSQGWIRRWPKLCSGALVDAGCFIMPHQREMAGRAERQCGPRWPECTTRGWANTKSATAARVSTVTDRPSRARFCRARIRCARLAMLSSRTKPSTLEGRAQ